MILINPQLAEKNYFGEPWELFPHLYYEKKQFRKTYIRFSEDYTNIIVETLETDKEQLRKDVEDWTHGELARLEKLMTQTQQKINTIKETQPK